MKYYYLTITEKIGFSCYDVVYVECIKDLGDSYNVIAGDLDMFLDKEYCDVTDHSIVYRDNNMEVYLEEVE